MAELCAGRFDAYGYWRGFIGSEEDVGTMGIVGNYTLVADGSGPCWSFIGVLHVVVWIVSWMGRGPAFAGIDIARVVITVAGIYLAHAWYG